MERQRLEYHRIIRAHLSTAYLLPEEKIDFVLPRFLQSLQNLVLELDRVAETESLESVSRSGHAIKGALLNLGLRDLATLAFALEENSRKGDFAGDCTSIIAELKGEIAKIV
ncbi:MAG: Hpt domain-containing protein [Desulfobulbaceae bacterium]